MRLAVDGGGALAINSENFRDFCISTVTNVAAARHRVLIADSLVSGLKPRFHARGFTLGEQNGLGRVLTSLRDVIEEGDLLTLKRDGGLIWSRP